MGLFIFGCWCTSKGTLEVKKNNKKKIIIMLFNNKFVIIFVLSKNYKMNEKEIITQKATRKRFAFLPAVLQKNAAENAS